MIASVVATLDECGNNVQGIIDEVARMPGVEIGEVGAGTNRIPITIDSPDSHTLESTTRHLQECHGVAFVDVVFVHFEDESECASAIFSEETKLS